MRGSPLCTAARRGAQDARKLLLSDCRNHRLVWTLRLSARMKNSLSNQVPFLESLSTLSRAVETIFGRCPEFSCGFHPWGE